MCSPQVNTDTILNPSVVKSSENFSVRFTWSGGFPNVGIWGLRCNKINYNRKLKYKCSINDLMKLVPSHNIYLRLWAPLYTCHLLCLIPEYDKCHAVDNCHIRDSERMLSQNAVKNESFIWRRSNQSFQAADTPHNSTRESDTAPAMFCVSWGSWRSPIG